MDNSQPSDQASQTDIFKGKKILLVEDEMQISDLYKHILASEGAEVLTVYDGQAGLDLIQNNPSPTFTMPNIILLDIMLPTMNGLGVLSELKKNELTKNIPVILLTNLGQADVIKQAFSLGAQGYYLKMRLDPKGLVETVKLYFQDPHHQMDFAKLDLD